MILTPNKHYRGPRKGTTSWTVGQINMRVGAAMAEMIAGSFMRGENLVNVTPQGLGIDYTDNPNTVRRAVELMHNLADARLTQLWKEAILRGD